MLLLYFEGLGFLLGFSLSFFRRRIYRISSPKIQRVWIFAIMAGVVVGWVVGTIWHTVAAAGVGSEGVLDYGLGFLLLAIPGWAAAMAVDWLVGKWVAR